MARYKIGDIIKFMDEVHYLILDVRSVAHENDRYDYLVLEKGYTKTGIAWWVDKNSEWIT